MVLEIAPSGGETFSAGEEVLVNAQHGGASQRMLLREMAFETVTEVAFHGGGAEALVPAHPATVDAIPVLTEYGFAERLAGVLARQNSRKPLPELTPTIQA
jgi:hypothetical protein